MRSATRLCWAEARAISSRSFFSSCPSTSRARPPGETRFRSNNCVAIHLRSLAKAERFFGDVLGFKLRSRKKDGLVFDTGVLRLYVNRPAKGAAADAVVQREGQWQGKAPPLRGRDAGSSPTGAARSTFAGRSATSSTSSRNDGAPGGGARNVFLNVLISPARQVDTGATHTDSAC